MAKKNDIPYAFNLDEEAMITAFNRLQPAKSHFFDIISAVSSTAANMKNYQTVWNTPTATMVIGACSLFETYMSYLPPQFIASGDNIVSVVPPQTEEVTPWGKSYLIKLIRDECDQLSNPQPFDIAKQLLENVQYFEPNLQQRILEELKIRWWRYLVSVYHEDMRDFNFMLPTHKHLVAQQKPENILAFLVDTAVALHNAKSATMPTNAAEAIVASGVDLMIVEVMLVVAQEIKLSNLMQQQKGARKLRKHYAQTAPEKPVTATEQPTTFAAKLAVDNT